MTQPTREPSPRSDRSSRTTIVAWRPTGTTETTDIGDLATLTADPEVRLWVDAILPEPESVRAIAEALGLHHLIAEDITERNQRAKIETFDDVVHIVLFGLNYRGEVETTEIDVVLTDRAVVSVHGPEWDARRAALLRMGPGHLLGKGTDFLLYALSDAIVDGYFPVLDRLADEIDALQDEVMASASDWSLQRLFLLKRELLEIRRATSPAREIFNQLTNRDLGLIQHDRILYFRDVYDHLIRLTDELDSYRELVGTAMDIYLSQINNNLNEVVKRLTAVTVILAGLGAVAGIFGMSEAAPAVAGSEGIGFWLVSLALAGLAGLAAIYFRRIGWI
jgi:magnesium transporter